MPTKKKVAGMLCCFRASKMAAVLPFSKPASKVRYRIFSWVSARYRALYWARYSLLALPTGGSPSCWKLRPQLVTSAEVGTAPPRRAVDAASTHSASTPHKDSSTARFRRSVCQKPFIRLPPFPVSLCGGRAGLAS